MNMIFSWDSTLVVFCFFFFQAEDGIRDLYVTGVQTCALPICRDRGAGRPAAERRRPAPDRRPGLPHDARRPAHRSGAWLSERPEAARRASRSEEHTSELPVT